MCQKCDEFIKSLSTKTPGEFIFPGGSLLNLAFRDGKWVRHNGTEWVPIIKTLSPETTSPVAEEEMSPGSLEVVFHDDERNTQHYPFDAEGWKGWCISKTGTVDMLLLMFTDHRELIPMVNIKKIVVAYNQPR